MAAHETDKIVRLREFLSKLPPGPVKNECSEALDLLSNAWMSFQGWDESGMATWKLGRAEDLRWDPPVISFRLERHGGTVLGSKRAELQEWRADVESLVAHQCPSGYRNLVKPDKGLDAKELAEQIADEILHNRQTTNLKWLAENRVKVNIGVVIPKTVKRTTEGRRKRLWKDLASMLSPHGWRLKKSGWTCERS